MKGIIFDAESVRAILDRAKTQTRRIVKPQPPEDCGRIFGPEWYEPAIVDRYGEEIPGKPVYGIYDECGYWGTKCPLKPGDVVYVRETFAYRIPRRECVNRETARSWLNMPQHRPAHTPNNG